MILLMLVVGPIQANCLCSGLEDDKKKKQRLIYLGGDVDKILMTLAKQKNSTARAHFTQYPRPF